MNTPERSLEPPEVKVAEHCEGCGEGLYIGEKYYPKLGVCEFCIHEYEKEAWREEELDG